MKQTATIRQPMSARAKLVLGAALSLAAPAWCQTPEAEPEPAAPVQSVLVSGVRDPAIMPYKQAYELLNKIAAVSNGHVQVLIKVTSSASRQPLPDLEVSLRGEKTFEKLSISPSGFLTVPLNRDAYDDKAEFLTNKKKGSLHVDIYLAPKLSAEALSYGEIVDAIEAGRSALAQLVPWYVRLVMPSIKEVSICYPDNKQAVAVSNSAEAVRFAHSEETSVMTHAKLFCAHFSSTERAIRRDSILTPASGWEALFR